MTRNQNYEAAVEKGTRLLQMLSQKDKTKFQSAYKDVEELVQNGHLLNPQEKHFELDCVAGALRELGVDDKMMYDGGENVKMYHAHDQDGAVQGEEDMTPHGYFSQVSNPNSDVLIADSNLTPGHAAAFDEDDEEGKAMELLALRHWSDVAFLQYLSSFPDSPVRSIPLKYVFRIQIQNSETFLVLNRIIGMHGRCTYDRWPGITFSMDSEEGKAILGTANGSGVAWMLIQHSKELGEKRIDKAILFYAPKRGDLFRWPSLLF